MHKRYLFSSGFTIDKEFSFDKGLCLRPAQITANHIELERYVRSQTDYGILCALANKITCELEVSAKTEKEAAIKIWNNQWMLILLSIILKAPIYHPIQSTHSSKTLSKGCCSLNNVFISPSFFTSKVECKTQHLLEAKELYGNFMNLLSEEAFTHATSALAHNFNEPKLSIRIATIWSGIEALLKVDYELNYRIPLICSILLTKTKNERLKKFKNIQKLYTVRSKCVHGSKTKSKELNSSVDESMQLLCDLIKLFCKDGKIPDGRAIKELPLIY
ncbi:MAG: hypothetical protein KAS59_01205 [Alphaproteobacteria bacterium]|nr:hypothetical protein [Alphaproteobacteria bacterium]